MAFRFWRALKRFMTKPIRPHQEKAQQRVLIARVVLVLVALVAGLYFEVPIIWWFLVAAVVCGVLIAFAMQWFRDRENAIGGPVHGVEMSQLMPVCQG
jgi:undecaprenyl pyrophosphate phosphatase UppP